MYFLCATLLPCALGVIGLDTGIEYKLNYLTSCLWFKVVTFFFRVEEDLLQNQQITIITVHYLQKAETQT